MAPIKLEDHIREKLQEREMDVSNNSWEKLQKQINKSPKKNNNKIWFYVAASIVSVIIISSLLLGGQQKTIEHSNKIVEVNNSSDDLDSKSIITTSTEEVISPNELDNPSKKETLSNKKQVVKNNKSLITGSKIPKSDSQQKNPNKDTFIAKNTTKKKELNEEEKFINSKLNEVVAQIKSSSTSISDEEINSLLSKAQQEIHSKKMIQKNKVDAEELLSVVEGELEASFRDRVFEALGDGYQKVRTAVVEREY